MIKVTAAEFTNQYADRWTIQLTVEKATAAQVMAFMSKCAELGVEAEGVE